MTPARYQLTRSNDYNRIFVNLARDRSSFVQTNLESYFKARISVLRQYSDFPQQRVSITAITQQKKAYVFETKEVGEHTLTNIVTEAKQANYCFSFHRSAFALRTLNN